MTDNHLMPSQRSAFPQSGTDTRGLTVKQYTMIHICAAYAARGAFPIIKVDVLVTESLKVTEEIMRAFDQGYTGPKTSGPVER